MHKNKPFLIVNADDFGQTPEVTKGILDCHKKGIVSSTTVLVTFADFKKTAQLMHKNPTLGFGIHFNLVDGKALSGKTSLTNSDGVFYPLGKQFIRALTFQIRRKDLYNELQAQITQFKSTGITPTHADSHRHTHVFPLFLPTFLKVFEKNNISVARLPYESLFLSIRHQSYFSGTFLTKILVSMCSLYSSLFFKKYSIRTTSKYLGMSLLGEQKKHLDMFESILNHVGPGITEILSHPGYCTDELKRMCPQYAIEREGEIATLINADLKKKVEKNFTLTTFAQLHEKE